ncbi:hypothetical protein R6Q59_020618 [Mikania micrantha]
MVEFGDELLDIPFVKELNIPLFTVDLQDFPSDVVQAGFRDKIDGSHYFRSRQDYGSKHSEGPVLSLLFG